MIVPHRLAYQISYLSHEKQVHPRKIIIVEGILIFTHPELCKELDMKVFVVSFDCVATYPILPRWLKVVCKCKPIALNIFS